MAAMVVVTLVSLAVAAVMSLVAWRLMREERRRSDARVAALAADIHGETGVASLFLTSEESTPGPFFRRSPRTAIAVGVVALASIVALGVGLTSGSRTAAQSAAAAAPVATAPPLELVSLSHELSGDRLSVRGVVRNPAGSAAVEQLVAVVLVFNHDGGFASSGRAIIDAWTLASGGESAFTIDVPGVTDVGRYRVSFKVNERIVEHIDLRGR